MSLLMLKSAVRSQSVLPGNFYIFFPYFSNDFFYYLIPGPKFIYKKMKQYFTDLKIIIGVNFKGEFIFQVHIP